MSASNQWVRARRFCRGLFFLGQWLHRNDVAAFPQIDKAEVFRHHVNAITVSHGARIENEVVQ